MIILLYFIRNLLIVPLLILLVALAAIIIGTVISELLYPLAELGKIDIP